MKQTLKWSLSRFCKMVEKRLENKFDVIIFIDGASRRRIGKSTLAHKICTRIKPKFNPKEDIVYSREDVINALSTKKHDVIFADEMTNVSYKRDFYLEDQKNLLKILDMYGDNYNLFIGVIPHFLNLDKHLLGLIDIRLTVIRRGVAVVHMPIKSMYQTDMWDVYNNQKEEMKWGKGNMKFQKLSTFVGILTFGDLGKSQREEYEKVKQEKRNLLYSKEIVKDGGEVGDEYDALADKVLKGEVDKDFLKQFALLKGITWGGIKSRLNTRIEKKGINKTISQLLSHYQEENKTIIKKSNTSGLFKLKEGSDNNEG